jgi:hypothetical protein
MIKATTITIFEDSGHEFVKQDFSDGSSVLMHKGQYDAIAVAAAGCAELVLAAAQ